MSKQTKKLIEVALPLEAINAASAREKSIRHGHPSTLHLWWARRPLAAARAVIFAQMVDDPSSWPELFPTEAAQTTERERLFAIIEDLVKWESTTDEKVLSAAREEIWQSWRRTCELHADDPQAKVLFNQDVLPAFHDPFAGGGALPLEAQRLGLESYASDLNPVAVLINKAMIEIPPRFAGRAPVNPEWRQENLFIKAAPALKGASALKGAPASSRQNADNHIRNGAGKDAGAPDANTSAPKEWFSRGYLPHFDQPELVQFITFRLADSLPQKLLEQWDEELSHLQKAERDAERQKRIRNWLDQGHGDCYLRDPRIARMVEDALLHFDNQRYRLLAWCVMPNHVHVLVEMWDGYALPDVVHSWKSFTATQANKLLGRQGTFWQREYFDRFIRNADHLQRITEYIEQNPVEAKLVDKAENWEFSSRGRKEGAPTLKGAPAIKGAPASSRQNPDNEGAGRDAGAPNTVAPDAGASGAQGLAEDVRYYGQWMRDEAEKRIGHLYPQIEITDAMIAERPDLEQYRGQKLTVIAWLWARTVKSPNPAFANVDVPLASTFMLSTKAGKEAYVEPVIENGGYRFTVKVGKPEDLATVKKGTKSGGSGSEFLCLMSGTPMPFNYLRSEALAGRMSNRLMAIVAEGNHGRVYISPTPEMQEIALQAKPDWKPETELPEKALGFRVQLYGMTKWCDLFTPRQLVALTTFSDLVQEARERVRCDALAAGMADDEQNQHKSTFGASAYADAVAVYLAFAVDKCTDYWSAVCSWHNSGEKMRNTFGRQAIPMVWDYAEANPFCSSSGNWIAMLDWVWKTVARVPAILHGTTKQGDAQNQTISSGKVVSTDPPYYDNIGYADLSDFFYVWLRHSLRPIYPELFSTLAVPKAEELVATPYRHGSKEKAEKYFLDGMTQAMHRLAEQAHPAFPVTIYYAFKQQETKKEVLSETDKDSLTPLLSALSSTGWETFLDAVSHAGFALTGTWPMRTEMGNRMISSGTNALASSIVLVCRKRAADAPTATRREFLSALKAELPPALKDLQRGNIAPVDLAQAAIGPGMAVYTRYAKVIDAEGKVLSVRQALALINQTLDEALAEQEGDFDADSRWAVAWFDQFGFEEGDYGIAETLSIAKNTSVNGMKDAGFLESGQGKVRLLRPKELSPDWKPQNDTRLTTWEAVHHLIRALEDGGETAAAQLTKDLGEIAETARELAYRLYTLCERKKRANEALSYNGLVQSWPEIMQLAREMAQAKPAEVQTAMDI